MNALPTPRQILETLYPHLQTAAAYARTIQASIAEQPEKEDSDNFFAAALSDADLSIQTALEVALLGHFPQLRFYGEEHAKTYNTQYFRSIELGPADDYLITLDPIDGTRYYLDGHSNYQIILGILNADHYEAVMALTPNQNRGYYALRGRGAFSGKLHETLADYAPWHQNPQLNKIYLGSTLGSLAADLQARHYPVISILEDYSRTAQVPNLNGLLSGDLAGAILATGKFIDGGAIAFLAQEMGFTVTGFDGADLPPLYTCNNYQWPGVLIAASNKIHQDLLTVVKGL